MQCDLENLVYFKFQLPIFVTNAKMAEKDLYQNANKKICCLYLFYFFNSVLHIKIYVCTNAYNICKEIFILCAYLNLNALFMYLRKAL